MAPATKAIQKRVDAAVAAFHSRYADSQQWGKDRWYNSLYPALVQPTTYCAVVNRYAIDEEAVKVVLTETEDGGLKKVDFPCLFPSVGMLKEQTEYVSVICYEREQPLVCNGNAYAAPHKSSSMPFSAPKAVPSSNNPLFTHWNMDAASVLAAHMLNARPGDHVLDMCAAPGGKSVVLAQKLFPQLYYAPSYALPEQQTICQSRFHVNEFDTTRYKRLTTNIKSYVPASLFPTPENPQAPVKILNKDLSNKSSISSLPFGVGGYDKVLIDAPCSSERHIIHAHEKAKASGQTAEEMLNWKSSHVNTLVKTQTGLLTTGLKALKIGGRLVYATCALGTEENDGVVEKVLENLKADRKRAKRNDQEVENWDVEFEMGSEGANCVTIDPILQRMTESTKYGRIALPDHGGWGPLYFSVMIKVERAKTTVVKTKTKTISRQ